MINIDKTIFKLEVLIKAVNYAMLTEMYNDLKAVKESLYNSRKWLVDNLDIFDENKAMIAHLDDQLVIVNKNVSTIKTALLTLEAQPFEHKVEFEAYELHMFCLN